MDMSHVLKNAWKRTSLVLGWIGLTGIIVTAALWAQQLHTLPRAVDKPGGRLYPRNIHGIVVYQTQTEYHRLEAIQYASVGVFSVSFLMSIYYKNKWGDL